ncbi:TerD family protein [Chromatium okenii]|jgi:stress response protein SCP2|uniref:Tellurium resistance protein TerX n=1 Tax=Chromatium okenii TaxID=61644 RepID=A0A2S7XN25_9GAMM|nr:TerD family protein [Chromatium okenii]PQJ95135.1 tellurium resistance protein TerX [Chromatium okenii]
MGISLKKGQGVSLKKTEHDLSKVTIGLGWDINSVKTGLFTSLLGKTTPDYDLDVAAFLCEADGKVHNLGRDSNGKATLIDSDVIFFNNLCHRSGCLWLTGDNRTGSGDGDDEQIIVKLNDLPAQYTRVVFVVQIYQGIKNNQSFAGVNNAFIRAVDARKQEMVRFNLSGGAYNDTCRSLLFAELIRESNGWTFNAIGTASTSDNFVDWLKQYV